MKKIYLLSILLFSMLAFSQAQNSFAVYEMKVKKGGERALAQLFDDYWGDANWKSGGVSVERIAIGDNDMTHRVIVFGQVGNRGRAEGDVKEFEWALFQQRVNDYVEEWGPSAAGRFISYFGGSPNDYPYIQLYEFEAENPAAFKTAFEKVAKKLSKIQDGRPMALGNYDIGGAGATHWVAIGHNNFGDLLEQKVKYEEVPKVLQEFLSNRGPVEPIRNFTVNIIKWYGEL